MPLLLGEHHGRNTTLTLEIRACTQHVERQ